MIDLANENQKENRLDMIREAMKDKAPLTYADLESSGQLQSFLETRETEMMAYFKEEQERAWQSTMSTFLEFFDPSYDETSSPM
ncbi:MAG: hypothetical protein QMD11_07420 [Smithella sp.]|nr:hypothetical protein [Smithella sp.]